MNGIRVTETKAIVELPRLLTVEEVAELTKVSASHIYALILEGAMPAVQFGRAKRIRPEDLNAFIESNMTITGY